MSTDSTDSPARSMPRLDLLRQMSDRAVFDALATGGARTRAELAVDTGLSKPTVSQSVRRLERAGLVLETGTQTGRRGGVGTFYDIAGSAGIVVAAELDQAGISVRTVDLAGRVLSQVTHAPTPAGDADALAAALHAAVLSAGAGAGPATRIRAAGISVASPVDPVTRRVVALPDAPFPEGVVQPVDLLADLVTGPVHVDNDVNLAALAERRHGAADTFVYLYLGGGLGAAVHVGDTLVRGAHGLAGEVGWLPTSPAPTEGDTLARHLVGPSARRGGPPTLDLPAILEILSDGAHAEHDETVTRLCASAAFAAASLCAAVDPGVIVLGGPLGTHPALLQPFVEAMERIWPQPLQIEASSLGSLAPLDGATFMALDAARDAALAETEA